MPTTSKNTSERLAALSALTSSAASVNLREPGTMAIKPAIVEKTTNTEPETTVVSVTEGEGTSEISLTAPPQPAQSKLEQKGKKALDSLSAVASPIVSAVADNASIEQEEAAEVASLVAEGVGEKPVPANAEEKTVDYSTFFSKTTSKKEASIRLAASHYDFLHQVSFLLGNNASLTDLVDNIIADWRTRYEPIMTKEMQKALRKKMSKF